MFVRRLLSEVLLAVFLAVPMFAAMPSITAKTDFTVRLDKPGIDSTTAQKGDEIRATVIKPAEFEGCDIVGKVNQSRSSGKVKGTSMLSFTFERLEKGSEVIPISGTLKQVTNSKGAADVDEEGHAIRKKNNTGKVAAGAALGALIGGLKGGAKGALVGAAIGGAATLVAVELMAESGADFKLDPGSLMLVTVAPQRETQQAPSVQSQQVSLQGIQQRMQKYPGAAAFYVRHDHGSTRDEDGRYCEGILYVFADHAVFETTSVGDGRNDSFDISYQDFKEVKTNFTPINEHNAFHIRFANGKNLNFTTPSNNVRNVVAAFPAPPRK